jgi:Mannosylglycerate hydrolase MGH1-like glycoside hydrolase domain
MMLPSRFASNMLIYMIVIAVVTLAAAIAPAPCHAQISSDNLAAAANGPLFTTYCADMTRAQFVPDQGYHFRYYSGDQSVAFTTDQAGDWGIVFERDGELVISLNDYYAAPVIHESWSDYVRYSAQPYDGIELTGRFHVHTSTLAIWEVVLENTTDDQQTITIAPYVDNELLLLPDTDEASTLSFQHEHPADGWTVDKQIPHPFKRYNQLSMQPTADASSVFANLSNESITIPEWVMPDEDPIFPLYGRLTLENGDRVNPSETSVQAYAFLKHDLRSLVTLNSPVYGSTWNEWKHRGYYALELGELEWAPRIYSAETGWKEVDENDLRIVASAPELGVAAQWDHSQPVPFAAGSKRHDLTLSESFADAPRNLIVTADTFGVHLTWDGDSKQIYRVYWNHMKCRMTAQEAASRGHRKDEYLLAGARSVTQFKFLAQREGNSFDLDLRPRVDAPDGSGKIKVAYEPEQDLFIRQFIVTATSADKYPGPASETVVYSPQPSLSEQLSDPLVIRETEGLLATGTALLKQITLAPGESGTVRIARQVTADRFEFERNEWLINNLANRSLDDFAQPHRDRFAAFDHLDLPDRDTELLLLSATNLLRQSMLPPEGQLTRNYYVFSREPTWGWGHGGQVFHESLSMMAYGLLDPMSAQGSMQVFREAQLDPETDSMSYWAYIPYRVGPYLNETIPTDGNLTMSGPFYTWISLDLFKMNGDQSFLEQMYPSCKQFLNYWARHRDTDNDAIFEWGGDAILESLRDASVVIWDQVAPPDSLEALDLNCMLVKEYYSLSEMSDSLDNDDTSTWEWKSGAELAYIVQRAMWDEETGFFYHIRKRGQTIKNDGTIDPDRFSFREPNDLKHMEIIGFLPLWAGIATPEQAERLVREHLTNPDEFWREYGVPSLSASDPYYDAHGYWNGPVWVQWNYLIVQGLLRYGYMQEARELTNRVSAGMIEMLSEDHHFWEFYSPDDPWGGWHHNYIWAGIIARMLHDVNIEGNSDE